MEGNLNYKVGVVQAAPIFLDLEASITKAIKLIEEASINGAKLIAFGETWLPGYPWWVWLGAPVDNMKFVRKYYENSLVVGSKEFIRICEAAKKYNIYVACGFSERYGGSLYISQMLISDKGEPINTRRKLKPTHVERTVFGSGDGSDLIVQETDLGRIGALACWEHLQPLSKYALYAQNEQVHFGAWPALSVYSGKAHAFKPEVTVNISQIYALEGSCFVLAPTTMVSKEIQDILCNTDIKRELLPIGGGYAKIFGPDSAPLGTDIPPTEEGIVYAEIDLGSIAMSKAVVDPAGHYSRPDVTQLLFDPKPKNAMVIKDLYEEKKQYVSKEKMLEENEIQQQLKTHNN